MRISNSIQYLILFFKSFKLLKYSYIISNYKIIRFFENIEEISIIDSNTKDEFKFITLLLKLPVISTILILMVSFIIVAILCLLTRHNDDTKPTLVRILIISKNDKILAGLDSNDSSIVNLTREILYNKAITL